MTPGTDSIGTTGMEHRICVAPMMDHTDRHFRFFLRQLAPRTGLYTEMITARAILHGDSAHLLAFDPAEHPVALQLGGSDPSELARAAGIASRSHAYDEINLNVGCPSDRVQSGRFGACLMADPLLVADCVTAISEAWGRPATVKTRIGIDDRDDYEFLAEFVARVARAGCETFVVHARKAILQGLSPKENRTIPPLRYDTVYRMKREFPDLRIVINGGVDSPEAVEHHLAHVDGVMIGRRACADPWFVGELDHRFLSESAHPRETRREIVHRMAEYASAELGKGERLHRITRHMAGLFAGQPGASRWRRFLAEQACRPGADETVLHRSLDVFERAA